ncbi:unnamed protein product [Larinioides sclopetarius]|uniref:DNA helicase MCM8 n=3 Tax=Larinioides sclopetarius TaxID=280406 RepID=A0AAV1ZIE6_9ARAC
MDDKKKKKWNPKFQKNFYKNNYDICSSGTSKKGKRLSDFSNESNIQWSLYLPEKYSDEDVSLINKLKIIENYLSSYDETMFSEAYKNRCFIVDIDDILKDENFLSMWENFKNEFESSPDLVIGLFGLAMERLIEKKDIRDPSDSLVNIDGNFYNVRKKINPRFIGLKNPLSFHDLKTYNYGKFVTIVGIIVRTSDIKPFCTNIAFMCQKCQTLQIIIQEKGCYITPNRCIGSECHATTFKPLLKSPLTQTIPWKTVRLQELNINQDEGGRVPRSVECELYCDLTETCIPGDVVAISGTLSLNNINEKKNTASKDACTYTIYLKANSVTCLKGKNIENKDAVSNSIHFKTEDLNLIKQIHSEDNLFQLMVSSLCPNIYGHELIKAGIVLALFGGGSTQSSELAFSTRENSHILIVGDPGLGKSQMLLATSGISPRGVYVCGNSTTTSGLTVTITKEGGGENSLEAGALVLADQGHCCIDEFDKMMHHHSALLEAMEQQTISMAKSGVVCTLPARTSIIAAANPSGGHYNKAKTVSENLRINGSLLSRFDLVFIIQDRPDQAFDSKMTEHVMGLHMKSKNHLQESNASQIFLKSPSICDSLNDSNQLLRKLQANAGVKLIPHKVMQKYISYARKFSQPKLTPEVSVILQNFYIEMRKQHKLSYNSIPITTRQLESLIRLTKARARIELRAFCTTNDAEEVIEIMKYSMRDTFSDEFGNIDFDRSIHGSGMSKRSQAKKLINFLTKAAAVKGDNCFLISEIKDLAKEAKISMDSFSTLLETLNDQGFLLKKGFQLYQIQTI